MLRENVIDMSFSSSSSSSSLSPSSIADHTFDVSGTHSTINDVPVIKYKREPFFDTPRVCDNCHVSFKHKGQYSGHLRKCRPDSPWNGAPTRRHNECLLGNPTLTGIAMSRIHKKHRNAKNTSLKASKHSRTTNPLPSLPSEIVIIQPSESVTVPAAEPANVPSLPPQQQQQQQPSPPRVPRPRRVKSSEKMVKDTINALLEHSRKCYSLDDLLDLDNNVQYMTTALARMHSTLSEIIARHHTVRQNLMDQLSQYAENDDDDDDDDDDNDTHMTVHDMPPGTEMDVDYGMSM